MIGLIEADVSASFHQTARLLRHDNHGDPTGGFGCHSDAEASPVFKS
jgi:hypothetical protein